MKGLPKPKGRQIDVLSLYPLGHYVILGTAGSGKTIIALLRAAYLSDPRTSTFGKTLLLTYNKVLTKYFDYFGKNNNQLEICTYFKFATGYLSNRNVITGWNQTLPDTLRRKLFLDLISSFKAHLLSMGVTARVSNLNDQFLLDEIDWIYHNGIRTEAAYLLANRIGRGTGLDAAARTEIWRIIVKYHKQRKLKHNVDFDFFDLPIAVSDELAKDQTQRRFRHIVIDEGQEFSPEMLRSIVAAIPANGSLTFLGDLVQQTRGLRTKTNWRAAGLVVPAKSEWRFEHNYRNSPGITKFALEIASMPYFVKEEEVDLVMPKNVAAAGQKPSLIRCPKISEELNYIAQFAVPAGKTRTVGILCRTNDEVDWVAARLTNGYTKIDRHLSCWTPDNGIFLGTYHSSQGLEFDTVILPFCSEDRLPVPVVIAQLGRDGAEAEDGRVFYIAVTRAKSELIITYSDHLTLLISRHSPNLQRFQYGYPTNP